MAFRVCAVLVQVHEEVLAQVEALSRQGEASRVLIRNVDSKRLDYRVLHLILCFHRDMAFAEVLKG
jgi:hypothetical protein